MMPLGPRHASSIARLLCHLTQAYGESAIINAGAPSGLGKTQEFSFISFQEQGGPGGGRFMG